MTTSKLIELDVDAALVKQLFTDDRVGHFSGTSLLVSSLNDTFYEIEFLAGGVTIGTHRGVPVPVRRVNYTRAVPNTIKPEVAKNHNAYFVDSDSPKIHFTPSFDEEDDGDSGTRVSLSTGILKPSMTLVIDWNNIDA